MITPRGYQKKSQLLRKKPKIVTQNYTCEYEPSNIISVYDSLEWQWRRVTEWDYYINDPVENIKGHMIT